MSFRSVQFRSSADVLEAYDNLQLPMYSLTAGTQMIFKYQGDDLAEGRELLEKWLDILERNDSAAIYTLRIYEQIPGKQLINNKTPYHYSFNFRLLDQVAGLVPGNVPVQYGGNGLGMVKLLQDLQTTLNEQRELIKAQGEQIDELFTELEEEKEKPSIGATVLEQLIPIGLALAEKYMGPKPGDAISGAAFDQTRPGFTDKERERILSACFRLTKFEKDVPGLMEKLAGFAEEKPGAFRGYMATFKLIA